MIRLPAALLLLAAVARAPHACAQDISVGHAGAPSVTIAAGRLAALPAADVTLTYGNPPAAHTFSGPLIWTVLLDAHAVDPARHQDAVGQVLRIRGADGYVATFGAGEVSPEFENKTAILALSLDGKPLPRPRAVIPGEHRLGRNVRDVVRLALEDLPKAPP